MCSSTHHQDSHEIDPIFSTWKPSQQSKGFTSRSVWVPIPSIHLGDYHIGLTELEKPTSYQQVALNID